MSKNAITAVKDNKTYDFSWRLGNKSEAYLKITVSVDKGTTLEKVVNEYKYENVSCLYATILGLLDMRPSELEIEIEGEGRVYEYSRSCLSLLGTPVKYEEPVRKKTSKKGAKKE